MDSHISIKSALLAFFFLLVGCATLPSQEFNFSLDAGAPTHSKWAQKGLAASGRLVFVFQLREKGYDAADVAFMFGGSEKVDPTLNINISDKHCTGSYAISVQYKISENETRTIYPKDRLVWGKESIISVQWNEDDRVLLSINGSVLPELELPKRIRDIRVGVTRGGVDFSRLSYTKDPL